MRPRAGGREEGHALACSSGRVWSLLLAPGLLAAEGERRGGLVVAAELVAAAELAHVLRSAFSAAGSSAFGLQQSEAGTSSVACGFWGWYLRPH